MALRPITDFASQILKPYINNQDKAYAANIAPVETSPATSAHTAGMQIIYNGVLYDVTADINANDALATTGAGANLAVADDVSEQISNVKQALSDEAEVRATLGAHNLLPFPFDNMSGTYGSVPFIVADNGLITASGTTGSSGMNMYFANNLRLDVGEYKAKLFGSISGGKAILRDLTDATTLVTINSVTSEVTFSVTEETKNHRFRFYFNANADTAFSVNGRIAIFLASDSYNEYTMYAPTNAQLLSYKDNGVLGAKNLLLNNAASETKNGVTFTVNADKSVTVSTGAGGATANATIAINQTISASNIPKGTYIVSDGINDANFYLDVSAYNGNTWVKSFGTTASGDLTINVDYVGYDTIRVYVTVKSGAIYTTAAKLYPMIRLATDTDPTYQPYAMTNKELTDALSDEVVTRATLGAHNLFKPEWVVQTFTSQSIGVTVTNNGDGTCTLTGTAVTTTNHLDITNATSDFVVLEDGTYNIIIKNAEGIRVAGYNGSAWVPVKSSDTDTLTFTASSTYSKYLIQTKVTQNTVYNKTLYPMITLSTDAATNYTPYTKTNKELTDITNNLTDKATIAALGDDESGRTTASRAYEQGEFFYMDGKMYKVLTSIAKDATFTVGTNCSQTTIFAELKALAQ